MIGSKTGFRNFNLWGMNSDLCFNIFSWICYFIVGTYKVLAILFYVKLVKLPTNPVIGLVFERESSNDSYYLAGLGFFQKKQWFIKINTSILSDLTYNY
jgi:hypothetical protein